MRKQPLVTDHVYHVFTKSIAGYEIFRGVADFHRMIEMMKFYGYEKRPARFSEYVRIKNKDEYLKKYIHSEDTIVDLVAYCLMPTHIHFLLVQKKDKGISAYMKNILDSYTRYFNNKNYRKGPLWQGRFKSVHVETDEQLLHLTRYIHLNPTSSKLVPTPEDWPYSSYREYLHESERNVCNFADYIDINPEQYRDFVTSRKNYQAKLNEIKHLLLE
ncbi:hypothetical protein Flexsi_1920 [Flexistipes sinusarabici DSM 4947]|uniref:Transposase IS200-like domain-containing protein n=1 Tax=Flexistipes sinusarabici (strain ATCC 49648 / DSM 4947 / MAS 10) TaxID=717231 RepID=F8E4C7_FLESM|nr:transposase [Flexistipes sinusarabici]AEI15554.1 hypothetical protein Flexsi_1920 [Flexistipes sinusarabici DSM 4947]